MAQRVAGFLNQDNDIDSAEIGGDFHGLDHDEPAAWSGRTNLVLHGLRGSHLHQLDALDLSRFPYELGSFDIVAGNPSFGDKITDPSILAQFELGLGSKGNSLAQQMSHVLFVEAFVKLAKPGGRIVILLPDGTLANTGEQRVRDYLVEHVVIEAVIGLPRRVFRNDAKSNILLMWRKQSRCEYQDKPVFLAAIKDIWTELDEALSLLQAGIEST
jgi:type I restriction enzyme M protein